MKWTADQQNVIDSKDQSLLVTAAAGSGKTAVLVQRIISRLTDERNPWDIDDLLVVTFTKAAAKEMKERIYKALNDRLSENPANHRIRSMRDRVFSADIRTIDSFCKNVVSEYFSQIDMDPDFRFMDSGETELLKRDVLDEMLREEYQNAEEDSAFLTLSDIFSSKGKDTALAEIILGLYVKAQAYPWVHRYYESLEESIGEIDENSVQDTFWMEKLTDLVKVSAADLRGSAEALLRKAEAEKSTGYFDTVIESFNSDVTFFDSLSRTDNFQEQFELSDTYDFKGGVGKAAVGRKAPDDIKAIADGFKTERDAYKKFFKDKIKAPFLMKSPADIAAEENAKAPLLHEIVRLARKFDDRFLAEKKDRKSFEFSDIEHFAVKALINEDGTPTEAAENYRKRYREVMVDEYQDTNELNEMILSAVSRDKKNYFMVGDVKQSIYGFRNADPGIILRKSVEYKKDEDAAFRRIDLDKNFRSRQCVIDTVNDIFRAVMIPEVGGVAYDEAAELKFGADYYPDVPETQDNSTKAVILLRDDEELSEINDDKISLEATWVAQEIKRLLSSGFQVSDGDGGMRPVRYNDISLLLRSTKVNAAKIIDVMNAYGIPAENAADTGYFSAPEVVTTLNFLRIIDNPRQDIPMASVLTSMYVGLSEEDLAIISTAHKGQRFYQALLLESTEGSTENADSAAVSEEKSADSAEASEENETTTSERHAEKNARAALSPEKRQRLDAFLKELALLRSMKTDTTVFELIAKLYSDTGYDLLVSCLPGGERRRQNLLKLYDKAVGFAQTSFSGISAFISYIERLEKYNADEGEADVANGGDAVRIMTIHKSKGLEFPVVFVLGLGNGPKNDYDQVVTYKDRDITMTLTDVKQHTKNNTVHFQLDRFIGNDNELGERLRVLYVALTRAKEKLYLVGSLKSKEADALIKKGHSISSGQLSATDIRSANCYLKLMIPALVKNGYEVLTPNADDFAENEIEIETKREEIKKQLLAEDSDLIKKRALELAEVFTHPYAHQKDVIPKQKYSVSEIKKSALDEEIRNEALDLYRPEQEASSEVTIPEFLKEEKSEKKVSGSDRGTAMHRFLEKLDFTKKPLVDSIDEQIETELDKGFLTPPQKDMLDRRKLSKFLESALAERMQQAFERDELYREQAFVVGDSPELFFKDLTMEPSDEPISDQVIVQGIIDAFFIENGKIVLIDYKTDFVRTEEELITKYTKQLQLYQLALERGFDLQVSEMYLYSFVLGKTVSVPIVSIK
jgi:ATP-dependent helicase/nuclease subunit A